LIDIFVLGSKQDGASYDLNAGLSVRRPPIDLPIDLHQQNIFGVTIAIWFLKQKTTSLQHIEGTYIKIFILFIQKLFC
jgi:hypothetical protein